MSATSVYWIHHPDHTDMFTQGYIGISKDLKRRFRAHETKTENEHLKHAINKYGWDNLVKEVILVADKAYCLMVELQLRASTQIGWNIAKGGGVPPHINIWNKNRTIPKDELSKMQAKGFGFKKGHVTWNSGISYTEEQKVKFFDIGSYTRGKPAHNRGKPTLPHVKKAISEANKNKIISEETKRKMSLANKGRVFEQVTCPHCNTVGGLTTMKRWHFDKCTGAKKVNARTTVNGNRVFLGNFANKELAELAIQAYRKENNFG